MLGVLSSSVSTTNLAYFIQDSCLYVVVGPAVNFSNSKSNHSVTADDAYFSKFGLQS